MGSENVLQGEKELDELLEETVASAGPEAGSELADLTAAAYRFQAGIESGTIEVPPVKFNGENLVVFEIDGQGPIAYAGRIAKRINELATLGATTIEIVFPGITAFAVGNILNSGSYLPEAFWSDTFNRIIPIAIKQQSGTEVRMISFETEGLTLEEMLHAIPGHTIVLEVTGLPS